MTEKEYIQSLTDESVALLKEMIAVPSPSFSEDAVCTHICNWLTDKQISHERIGNNIIAEHIIDSDRPTLMLCAHIDTVAPCKGYVFDPYTPDYEIAAKVIGDALGRTCRPDEIVAGLGSNDDGASAAAMIAAYRYFCTAGCNIHITFRFKALFNKFFNCLKHTAKTGFGINCTSAPYSAAFIYIT